MVEVAKPWYSGFQQKCVQLLNYTIAVSTFHIDTVQRQSQSRGNLIAQL